MQLAQRWRAPDLDEEERKKIQEELKGVVEAQFKSRQEHRTKELEQLKKQVAELEKNLQDREKRQSEIVDRRVAELSGKGDPLGWDFQSSRQGPAPFGINGTQVSQFGTNGFSFVPATAPFVTTPLSTTQPATMPSAAAASPTQNAPRSFSGPPIQTGSAPGPIETRPVYPNATRQNTPDGAVRQMESKIKQLEETIRRLERSNRPDNKTTDATY